MLLKLTLLLFITFGNSNTYTVTPNGEFEEANFACEKFKAYPNSNSSNPNTTTWTKHDERLFVVLNNIIPPGINHTGSQAFDKHLTGVQAVLRFWGADEGLCDAGLFHSIYGTEGFQGHKLSLINRPMIREVIGSRAERLVWIFCMVDRLSVDQSLFSSFNSAEKKLNITLVSRTELGRFLIPIRDEGEWLDLVELTLADWLEQVEGAALKQNPFLNWKIGEAWAYRREAYRKMSDFLFMKRGERLRVAKQMHEEVYAREPQSTRHLHQLQTPAVSDAAKEARDAISSVDW